MYGVLDLSEITFPKNSDEQFLSRISGKKTAGDLPVSLFEAM
jgi:hypothetical protein